MIKRQCEKDTVAAKNLGKKPKMNSVEDAF